MDFGNNPINVDQVIILYKSKKKSFIIILAGIGLLVAAYVSFVYAHDLAFGWIFVIAAALVVIFGISNLLDRKPQIMLSARGITELYSIKEEIEWDAILLVDDFYFRGQDFVRMLIPHTYKPDLIRPTWFWRLDRIYAQQGLKAMYIRVSGLEINSKQLTTIIATMGKTEPTQRINFLKSVKGKF